MGHVMEIDKPAIARHYRGGKLLTTIMNFFTHRAFQNEVKYYIALILPKLYYAIQFFYKLPIKKTGEIFYL